MAYEDTEDAADKKSESSSSLAMKKVKPVNGGVGKSGSRTPKMDEMTKPIRSNKILY